MLLKNINVFDTSKHLHTNTLIFVSSQGTQRNSLTFFKIIGLNIFILHYFLQNLKKNNRSIATFFTLPDLFIFARFLDPIILGDYPPEMRKILGPNLPEFTSKQKKKLQTTKLDFIGLNHYTTLYLKDCIFSPCEVDPIDGDALVVTLAERDGVLIGEVVTIKLLEY